MQQAYGYFLKYADILDEGELLRLFDIVKSEAGSLSRAARRCGIERKTIYDMMKEGTQATRRTKARILRAAVIADLEKTLDLLLSKAVTESNEILGEYVAIVYQRAMRARNATEFNRAASDFRGILDRNAGLVVDGLQEEVSSMVGGLLDKSVRLQVDYIPPELRVMDTAMLAVVIPSLLRDLLNVRGIDIAALANKYRIAMPVAVAASQVIDEYKEKLMTAHPGTAMQEGSNVRRALAEFNLLVLRYSGYTSREIQALGDPSQLSKERMQELIHAKAVDALGRWAQREVDAGRIKFTGLNPPDQ